MVIFPIQYGEPRAGTRQNRTLVGANSFWGMSQPNCWPEVDSRHTAWMGKSDLLTASPCLVFRGLSYYVEHGHDNQLRFFEYPMRPSLSRTSNFSCNFHGYNSTTCWKLNAKDITIKIEIETRRVRVDWDPVGRLNRDLLLNIPILQCLDSPCCLYATHRQIFE